MRPWVFPVLGLALLVGCGGGNESERRTQAEPPTMEETTGDTGAPVEPAKPPEPKVLVHTRATNAPNLDDGPLRVEPSRLQISGSGAISYRDLKWNDWGEPKATATGEQCSGRTRSCQDIRLSLTGLKREGGKRLYTRYTTSEPGADAGTGEAAPVEECGNAPGAVFEVSARGVSCEDALAGIGDFQQAGYREGKPVAGGFRCRSLGSEGEVSMWRCTKGEQAFRFTTGG